MSAAREAAADEGTGARAARALADAVWPGVAASRGETLADVRLEDDRGRPLEGAVVVAALWPAAEARWRLEPGDAFTPLPIDRIEVDAGAGTIHVPDEPAVQAARAADDAVMLMLDVFVDGGLSTLLVERRRGARGGWLSPEEADDDRTRGEPLEFRLGPDQVRPLRLDAASDALPVLRNHQGATCSAIEFAGYSYPAETILTTAVYRGIRANVTYTQAAKTSSSLGVDAGNGTWSITGSATRRSTLTADYNTVTGSWSGWTNKEWRATYAHALYDRHCVDPTDVTWPYDDQWIVQRFTEPYKVTGFPSIINSRYPLPGCASRQSLEGVKSVTTDDQAATTYTVAFRISWGPGTFKGNARSNYTTEVKIRFSRPEASGYWYWCGDNPVPSDSYRVRAGR